MSSINVLFACLGNICRSPLAQDILERLLEAEGLGEVVQDDSCGTGALIPGLKPASRPVA